MEKYNNLSIVSENREPQRAYIQYYEQEFPLIKLATRIHARPFSVVEAYDNRSYSGSVLRLLEPDHSTLLRNDEVGYKKRNHIKSGRS